MLPQLKKLIFKVLTTFQKGRHEFNVLPYKLFGCEGLHDPAFLYFLATYLCTNHSNLKKSIDTWFDAGMELNRGKSTLPAELRQKVYDTSVENTVASADNRSARAAVCISKAEYIKRYHGIEKKTVQV